MRMYAWNRSHLVWEDVLVIQKYYPNFNLQNEVGFNGGGIVRDSTLKRIMIEWPSNKEEESKWVGGKEYLFSISLDSWNSLYLSWLLKFSLSLFSFEILSISLLFWNSIILWKFSFNILLYVHYKYLAHYPDLLLRDESLRDKLYY